METTPDPVDGYVSGGADRHSGGTGRVSRSSGSRQGAVRFRGHCRVVEMRRDGSSRMLEVLTGGMGRCGPPCRAEEGDVGMIWAIIGSVGFLLAVSVGWSWLEGRLERRRVADS
jgi:hypothetical protein